jgi:purine catabolism regulator
MTSTVRTLIADHTLRLRLLSDPTDERLDAPLLWVHSSDLPDPTAWLEPGQALLTDGDQFLRPGADPDAYVSRLRECGILALGLATGILHPEVPPEVLAACTEHGLPLFEVDRRTPFMAIIRLVADEIARERQARLEWSIDAQRAIARAAVRPDGLPSVLRELERQLGAWVAMFDSAGTQIPTVGMTAAPAELMDAIGEQVSMMLARGTRSAARVELPGGSVNLQSVGSQGRIVGVLAAGVVSPLDRAGADVFTSVIALASVALDQTGAMEEARSELRAGVFAIALHDPLAALAVARRAGIALPTDPIRLAAARLPKKSVSALEAEANATVGLFAARHDDEVVIIGSAGSTSQMRQLLGRHARGAGLSGASSWAALPEALAQASRASSRAGANQRVIEFDELAATGMLGLIEQSGGSELARSVLAPLADNPEMLRALATWLRHNGAFDPAARELGMHRHSLASRVSHGAQLLRIDLDQFAGRAELWTAISLAEPSLLFDPR